MIASGSKDGSVIIWSYDTSLQIWKGINRISEEFGGKPVWSVEFSQIGGMLMVSFGDDTAQSTIMFKEVKLGEYLQLLDFNEEGFEN